MSIHRGLRLAALALALALPFVSGRADASNVLRLEPPAAPIAVGDALDVTLALDFAQVTLGGAVALSYDASALELVDVAFDGALPDDPDFRCPSAGLPGSVACPGAPGFVSFGTLAGLPTGELAVASLRLVARAPGRSELGLRVASPFADAAGSPLDVSLAGASVRVVPEPGVGVLGAAGLLSLIHI